MKKVISILLAVAMLACAVPAFAVPTTQVNGSKNGQYTLRGSVDATNMPVFRTGDEVTIRIGNLSPGDLTVATFKVVDSALLDKAADFEACVDSDNIQFIDQYEVADTAADTEQIDITFEVRSTEAGVYYFVIYNNENTWIAYYRMGDVTVKSVQANGDLVTAAQPYKIEQHGDKWSIGFVGKASLTRGTRFSEAGVNLGFKLNGGKFTNYVYPDAITGERIDTYFDGVIENNNIEAEGTYSVIYGMTVYNVPDSETAAAITATADSDIH